MFTRSPHGAHLLASSMIILPATSPSVPPVTFTLNDLPVSDAGLANLATTSSPVANLDLRGCPVSNDGLAHLKDMTSLKALRFNGVSGKTTVDDGGMVHLAKLTNLKVLALD